MSNEFDMRLREAVFHHVSQLRRAGGGVVTAHALNQGLVFQGERIPIWSQQKGIFRPKVLRTPGAALSIQTSFQGPYDDQINREDELISYRYRGTDPEHPDNVAMVRAMEFRLPLLYLVAVAPGLYDPIFPCYVVDARPEELRFILAVGEEGVVKPPPADPHADWPLKVYITRQVRHRLHQRRFRYLVLNAYSNQCAMCRLRQPPLLDAAHILEDRDERGLPEVPNGLALCRIHHAAYDENILGIDPDYRIHLRADVLTEVDGPMLRYGLQELHGERILVPRRDRDRPNPEYLAERFERFRAA